MVALAGLLVCLLLGYTGRPLHAEAAAPSADGLPGEWQRTTPGGGGAFATVGAGPTGIVLAASDLSGAYRSRDRGRTWDTIGAVDGLTATHIGSVGFDPQDGNLLYLGTNTGIFRSANGGNTVTQVFTCPTICDVSAIRFAPSNPQIGYAAYHPEWNSTQGRIYKTTDRGLTWSLTSATPPANLRILKLLVHPTNPNTVYLLSGKARFGTGNKALYRSTNGGSTWTRLGSTLGDVLDFTQEVSNPSVLYLTTYALFDTGQGWQDYTGSLYRSSDGGNTWSKRSDRTGALWLDRDDLKRVRIIDVARQQPWDARRGVWESADQGATWSQVSTADTWGLGWTNGWWVYHESFDGHAKTIGEDMFDPDALWWTNTRYVMATFDDGRRFDTQYTNKVGVNGWQSTQSTPTWSTPVIMTLAAGAAMMARPVGKIATNPPTLMAKAPAATASPSRPTRRAPASSGKRNQGTLPPRRMFSCAAAMAAKAGHGRIAACRAKRSPACRWIAPARQRNAFSG
jgi:hypothetical protein